MSKKESLDLYIDEDYLNALPRLSESQYQALKESIKEDGLLEAITVAEDGKILDGHTRHEICTQLGIPIRYKIKKFDNPDQEKLYVVRVNLKRRQLNDFQIYELFENERDKLLYERNSEKSKKMWDTRKGIKEPESKIGSERYENSSSYKFSKMTGLGTGVIEGCAYLKKHGTDKLLNDVRTGKVTLNQARMELMKRNNFKPNTAPKPEKILPKCKKCGAMTRTRRLCHVHKEICCTKCEWGI